MNDYLKQNLKAVEKRFPELVRRIQDAPDTGLVRVEKAASGDATGVLVFPNGQERRLHSSRDPKREAMRWAESVPTKPNQTLAVFGPGMGHPLEALLKTHGKDLAGVWIFESSVEVFRAFLSQRDWTGVLNHPGTRLFVDVSETELREHCQQDFQRVVVDGIVVAEYEPGMQSDPQWFQERGRNLSDLMVQWASEVRTVMERGRLFARNTLVNFRDCGGSYLLRDLGKRLQGRPAIMVSAGPSLDKNARKLLEAKGRIPIIAVDTALRILGMHGVAPDWVVTIDALGISVRHYENIVGLEHIPLVYDLEATVDLLGPYPGPKILMGNNKPILYQWLEEAVGPLEGLTKGLTVAQATFGFLAHHGASPIILVGQDLSYEREGGRTHASGAAFQGRFQPGEGGVAKWENPLDPRGLKDVRYHWVPANDGGTVPTDNTLLAYLKRFEDDIARFGVDVVNATEGGALIRGARVHSLEEVYRQVGLESLSPVKGMIDLSGLPTIGEAYGENLAAALIEMVRLLREGRERCQAGFERCDKLHRDLGWKKLSPKDLERRRKEILAEFQWVQKNKRLQTIIERGLMNALYMLHKSDLPPPDERTDEHQRTAVERYRTFFHDAVVMIDMGLEILEEKTT